MFLPVDARRRGSAFGARSALSLACSIAAVSELVSDGDSAPKPRHRSARGGHGWRPWLPQAPICRWPAAGLLRPAMESAPAVAAELWVTAPLNALLAASADQGSAATRPGVGR